MNSLTTIGRILFALPFALFGINHFLMMDFYTGMLTSFIPFGGYMIILTGVLLIGTSLSIILKKFIRISTFTLAALLLLFIATIHIPHLIQGEVDVKMTLVTLLKDISLLGGALMIGGACQEREKV